MKKFLWHTFIVFTAAFIGAATVFVLGPVLRPDMCPSALKVQPEVEILEEGSGASKALDIYIQEHRAPRITDFVDAPLWVAQNQIEIKGLNGLSVAPDSTPPLPPASQIDGLNGLSID